MSKLIPCLLLTLSTCQVLAACHGENVPFIVHNESPYTVRVTPSWSNLSQKTLIKSQETTQGVWENQCRQKNERLLIHQKIKIYTSSAKYCIATLPIDDDNAHHDKQPIVIDIDHYLHPSVTLPSGRKVHSICYQNPLSHWSVSS